MSLLYNAAKKDMLRRFYRKKRRELSREQREEQDAALCKIISELPEFAAAETVLLYAPLETEVNVLPLFEVAKKLGKRVAFPRCDTARKKISFYYVSDLKDLCDGSYGIREPGPDAKKYGGERSVCVLPGLAFDTKGNRLGYGGGYYDKFLSENETVCIAPVRDGFLSEHQLPAEEHDIKCDIIVTPRGVF